MLSIIELTILLTITFIIPISSMIIVRTTTTVSKNINDGTTEFYINFVLGDVIHICRIISSLKSIS